MRTSSVHTRFRATERQRHIEVEGTYRDILGLEFAGLTDAQHCELVNDGKHASSDSVRCQWSSVQTALRTAVTACAAETRALERSVDQHDLLVEDARVRLVNAELELVVRPTADAARRDETKTPTAALPGLAATTV